MTLAVGVVFGGRSVEHDVSIVTAHQVMAALEPSHEVVPIYVTRDGRWLSSPRLNDLEVFRRRRYEEVGEEVVLTPGGGRRALVALGGRFRKSRAIPLDVVVPAIHGTFGEDGTLQGLLELADVPYTGSGVLASAAGMNKVAMKAAFVAHGLPVVPHVEVDVSELDGDLEVLAGKVPDAFGWPVFVKPSRLGSSVGIGRADDLDALAKAIDVARRYDAKILIEKAMENCVEINCSVLGGPGRPPEASVCEQPIPWREFLSFEDKYMRGGKPSKGPAGMAQQERRIPAPISEELTKQVQENAVAAFEAIGAAGVARVDSFVREETGESWVMEINTVPGSFSFYLWEASGLGFGELMESLIDIARETHRRKGELLFSFDSGILDARPGGKSGG